MSYKEVLKMNLLEKMEIVAKCIRDNVPNEINQQLNIAMCDDVNENNNGYMMIWLNGCLPNS